MNSLLHKNLIPDISKYMILKILVKDNRKSKNKVNKRLFYFLNENIENIIKSGYVIRIIIIDETNCNKFIKQKITTTPAIINDSNNHIEMGVTNIINYIIHLYKDYLKNNDSDSDSDSDEDEKIVCKNRSSFKDKVDDDINNYLQLQINDKSDELDEDEYDEKSLKKKEMEFKKRVESRNKNNKNNYNHVLKQHNKNNNVELDMDIDEFKDIQQKIDNDNTTTVVKKIRSDGNTEDDRLLNMMLDNEETSY